MFAQLVPALSRFFAARRPAITRPRFRPALELLEGRQLPSQASPAMFRAPAATTAQAPQAFTPRPFPVRPAVHAVVNPAAPSGPVAATYWTGYQYLVSNYTQLHLVDFRTGAATLLTAPAGVRTWSPTAVAVVPGSRHLLVANTTGRDVLEVALRGNALHLVRRYTHPSLRGPEGVAVAPDGRSFAVADFYSNQLLHFGRGGDLRWVRRVNSAHGVTIAGGSVYATSCVDGKLYRFDLAGRLLAEAGQRGWGPGEYLWPLSIQATATGVVVSDSRTGKLTSLTPGLRLRGWLGGNGPRFDLFNMPYAVTATRGRLVVADAVKSRLLLFEGGRCVAVVSRDPLPTAAERRAPLPVRPGRYVGYVDLAAPARVGVPGLGRLTWYPGLASYHRPTAAGFIRYAYPGNDSLFTASHPYFTWAVPTITPGGQNVLLLGHAQGFATIVVDAAGRAVSVAGPVRWKYGTGLVDNYGRPADLTATLDTALALFRRHDEGLAAGVDPLEAVRQTYWAGLDAGAFGERVRANFTSLAGRDFFQAFRRDPSPAARTVARARYFDAVARQRTVRLQEVFLVNLLAR